MTDPKQIVRKAFSYKVSMEAYAYSIIHDWSLAEHAVQETLIKLSKALDLDEKGF
jgi:DNA-directed RNA polymerase specialized sigma24 family protein